MAAPAAQAPTQQNGAGTNRPAAGAAAAAAAADDGVGPTSIALAAVERVAAMSIEEVRALLEARSGGRKTVIAEDADGKPVLRRAKQKVVVPGRREGGRVFTLAQLLAALCSVPALCCAAFLVWWRPYLLPLGGSTVAGILGGVLFAYLYSTNVKQKQQSQQLVRGGAAGEL